MVSLFGRGFNSLQLHDSREKVLRPEWSGDFFCMHVLLFGWFTALWKSISDCFLFTKYHVLAQNFQTRRYGINRDGAVRRVTTNQRLSNR